MLIGIVTEKRYLNLDPSIPYQANILREEAILKDALERVEIKCSRNAWDDQNVDWSQYDAIILRTTWNYFDHIQKFRTWLYNVSRCTRVLNTYKTLIWNMDKSYLFDLHQKGIRIPETYLVSKGDQKTLHQCIEEYNIRSEIVIKPTVAAAARNTHRIALDALSDYEERFQKYIAEEDMLIQIFQKNVVKKGEVSLMYMNGQYTHSVLKIAKKGDFRVQDDFGGTVHDYEPSDDEIEFGRKAIHSVSPLPLYGRVDIIWDNEDRLCVSELELVEPELWFRKCEGAADALAKGIKSTV